MTEIIRTPLLYDMHNHPSLFTLFGKGISISDEHTKDAALKKIFSSLKDDLNLILGWDNSKYDITQEDLEDEQMILVVNTSYHGFMLNKAAEEELAESEEVRIGLYDTNWVEHNLSKVFRIISEHKDWGKEDIKEMMDHLTSEGILLVDDMLVLKKETMDDFRELGLDNRVSYWCDLELFNQLDDDYKSRVKGVKFFLDGSFGMKTAAMKENYLTGESGDVLYSQVDLIDKFTDVFEAGKPVAVHAIGDLAIKKLVEVFSLCSIWKMDLSGSRIEHAEMISLESAKKAKDLGLILCPQPNFTTDNVAYHDRLSEKQLSSINNFRMLIDKVGFKPGEDLFFGSDGMPSGAKAALQYSLFPTLKSQELTLDEFIQGYTVRDETKGFIEFEVDYANRMVLEAKVTYKE